MDIRNTEKVKIKRFENGSLTSFEDVILVEKTFTLFLNGEYFDRMTCTGKEITELIAGHLFCGGRIRSVDELGPVTFNDKAGSVYAQTVSAASIKNKQDNAGNEPVNIDYEKAVSVLFEFQEMSELFKLTGSVHSAALLDADYKVRFFSDDMSRFNAVEKVIGKALLSGEGLRHAILVTSSRMPFELLQKAYRAGIKAVFSISAPTLESVRFARENKITLLGMFRGNRVNVYSDGTES